MWGTKVSGQVNNGWRLQYTRRQMKEVAVHVTSYNDKKRPSTMILKATHRRLPSEVVCDI